MKCTQSQLRQWCHWIGCCLDSWVIMIAAFKNGSFFFSCSVFFNPWSKYFASWRLHHPEHCESRWSGLNRGSPCTLPSKDDVPARACSRPDSKAGRVVQSSSVSVSTAIDCGSFLSPGLRIKHCLPGTRLKISLSKSPGNTVLALFFWYLWLKSVHFLPIQPS